MWHYAIVVVCLFGCTMTQRSPYAGNRNRPNGPRFRPSTDTPSDSDLGDRLDIQTTPSPLPADLQGTLEDAALVQRVSEWPEDKQPYWYKNRHAIAAHRGDPSDPKGTAEQVAQKEDAAEVKPTGGLGQRSHFGFWNSLPLKQEIDYSWYEQQAKPDWSNWNQQEYERQEKGNYGFQKAQKYYGYDQPQQQDFGYQQKQEEERSPSKTTTWKPNKKYVNLSRQEAETL